MRLSPCRPKPALLKADTAWNTPLHSAPATGMSWTVCQRVASTAASAASQTTVTPSTRRATPATSPSATVWVSAWVSRRERSCSERFTISPSSAAAVMRPNPPAWISTRITACPKPDQ